MKDFTPKKAQQWVEQELAKHQSVDSLRERIAGERQMIQFAAKMPGMPNTAGAHQDLHDKLAARLTQLEQASA